MYTRKKADRSSLLFYMSSYKSTATYDFLSRKTSFTDARENTTTQKWNGLNKLSETIAPSDTSIDKLQTIYQYDKLGSLVYSKDNLGTNNNIKTYTYDSLGRNLSITVSNEAGDLWITTRTNYDLNGNVTEQKDGKEYKTTYEYDSLNRKTSVTNAKNQKTTYDYDKNGNLIKQTDYLGNYTRNIYDGINRLVETRDTYEHIIKQLEYNDANAQIASYDALKNKTIYSYDKNLRQTGTTVKENSTSMVYDSRGNIIEKKDARGYITTYQYDAENHLTKVSDALGNSTSYTYDVAGNLLTQTDGNGNVTSYSYNCANLVMTKTDPSGQAEKYTYYANGKLKKKTDRNGVDTAYTYDVFGRLVKEDAGGQVQSYLYDKNGNLLEMTDSTGKTIRTYDMLNRNDTKTVPSIGKSIYAYDQVTAVTGESLERITDPKGNITLKTYDKVGRLSKVTADGKTTIYEYEDNGNRKNVKYPDGTTEAYTYDENNHIKSLINSKGGNPISSYSYTYDPAGNQLTKTESKGTTKYTYDELSRLKTVAEPNGKITSYTYDGAGNRILEKVEQGIVSSTILYSYDSNNRLKATLSSDGTDTRYLYDNNGNLVSKSIGKLETINPAELAEEKLSDFDLIIKKGETGGTGTDQLSTYNYDRYNRLTKIKSGSSTTVSSYNAQGYRVEKKVNSTTTRYLYEYDKVVLETDGSSNQTAFNVYGTNLLYRSVKGTNGTTTQSCYYLYNAHGDVTALINAAGGIAATYDYDAFGNIISKTGTADNPIRYAGYQYDEETRLYYLNARYYDSVTSRFLSENDSKYTSKNDPLSLNLYTYCQNNPVKYTDPSGHKVKKAQTLNLVKGFVKGAVEELKNTNLGDIKNNVKNASAMIDLAKGIASGDVTKKDLKAMGIDVVCGDIKYIIKNSNIITDKKSYSNAKVEEFGKHLAGAYAEVVNAGAIAIGVAQAAKGVVSRVQGAVKGVASSVDDVARGAGKADEVVKGVSKTLDPAISKNIDKALRSTNPGTKLEGEVANALGDDVVSFQRKIDSTAGRIGEIDVETSNYIIEVTNGASSKTGSEFAKYFETAMNPSGKGVILYAPNLNISKIPGIETAGVKVIQSMDELLEFLGVK